MSFPMGLQATFLIIFLLALQGIANPLPMNKDYGNLRHRQTSHNPGRGREIEIPRLRSQRSITGAAAIQLNQNINDCLRDCTGGLRDRFLPFSDCSAVQPSGEECHATGVLPSQQCAVNIEDAETTAPLPLAIPCRRKKSFDDTPVETVLKEADVFNKWFRIREMQQAGRNSVSGRHRLATLSSQSDQLGKDALADEQV